MTDAEQKAYELYPDYTDEQVGDLGLMNMWNETQKAKREAYLRGLEEGEENISSAVMNAIKAGKAMGINKVSSSLPKWTKTFDTSTPEVIGIMTDWILRYNGYEISITELFENLEKEH